MNQKTKELLREYFTLPEGTITHKTIGGRMRTYLQWRDENGKTKSRYLKPMEVEEYERKVRRRKELGTILGKLRKMQLTEEEDVFLLCDSSSENHLTGDALKEACRHVASFLKRDCYRTLECFLKEDTHGKVCALYGLRRTGKTTMLFQAADEFGTDASVYMKMKTGDTMSDLFDRIRDFMKKGIRYFFIDEITLLDDFINTASVLSDVFSFQNVKIVLSGTDSFGFALAAEEELYDRCVMIHTSYIPFQEYARLLNVSSLDMYIEYGGTLKRENMGFDDPEYRFEEASFRNDESTRKYIDTSIARNIQHSLKNDHQGENFGALRELYLQDELTNAVNRVIENINHDFVKKIITERFVSHDLGSAKQLLLKEYPSSSSEVLYKINEKDVLSKMKELLDIREKEECSIVIEDVHVKQLRKYLEMLDVLRYVRVRNGTKEENKPVFTQPGMRYSLAKALIYSLMQEEVFGNISVKDKMLIRNKILEDVQGRMTEDIILYETSRKLPQKVVFKQKFAVGEFDMVIYDPSENNCSVYEIKHSDKVAYEFQTRHLHDEGKLIYMSSMFGMVQEKVVLYHGKTEKINDVFYQNIEEFLKR